MKICDKEVHYSFLNYTVALFFMATPIESIAVFDNFSIAKLSALFVMLGWMTQSFKTISSKMSRALLGLTIFSTLSIAWSIDVETTFNQVVFMLWPSTLIMLALCKSINKIEDIKLYLLFYVVGCCIASITMFLFRDLLLAEATMRSQERLTSFGQDQNTLAYLLCVGVTILLDCFRKSHARILQCLCLVMIFLFVLTILSTGSRTGTVLALIIFGFYSISSGNIKRLLLILLCILIASPFVYSFIPESIWERFSETTELINNRDFSGRGETWEAGLKAIFSENIIFGVGFSNFSTMLQRHFGWHMASHNTYLSYFCDLGIIGFVLFLSVLYKLFKIVKLIAKKHKDLYIYAYYIPFLIIIFTLETEYKRWIFILAILLEAYYRLGNNNKPQ